MSLQQAQGALSNAAGFVDAEAAMVAVRRLKLRTRLQDAEASIARILNRLNVVAQDNAASAASGEHRLNLTARDCESDVGDVGGFVGDGKRVSERELLDGAELFLQFLDRVESGVGHGLFSVEYGALVSEPRAELRHSLCGGDK